MDRFKARRGAHEYIQTNYAAPEKVFPLLCPVREADWIPGWQYELVYSESGVAELGCVFTTRHAACVFPSFGAIASSTMTHDLRRGLQSFAASRLV